MKNFIYILVTCFATSYAIASSEIVSVDPKGKIENKENFIKILEALKFVPYIDPKSLSTIVNGGSANMGGYTLKALNSDEARKKLFGGKTEITPDNADKISKRFVFSGEFLIKDGKLIAVFNLKHWAVKGKIHSTYGLVVESPKMNFINLNRSVINKYQGGENDRMPLMVEGQFQPSPNSLRMLSTMDAQLAEETTHLHRMNPWLGKLKMVKLRLGGIQPTASDKSGIKEEEELKIRQLFLEHQPNLTWLKDKEKNIILKGKAIPEEIIKTADIKSFQFDTTTYASLFMKLHKGYLGEIGFTYEDLKKILKLDQAARTNAEMRSKLERDGYYIFRFK